MTSTKPICYLGNILTASISNPEVIGVILLLLLFFKEYYQKGGYYDAEDELESSLILNFEDCVECMEFFDISKSNKQNTIVKSNDILNRNG